MSRLILFACCYLFVISPCFSSSSTIPTSDARSVSTTVTTLDPEVEKECHKIRIEIKDIPKKKLAENLIIKLAAERVDKEQKLAAERFDKEQKLAAERFDKEQKLAAKDNLIGKIDTEKESAEKLARRLACPPRIRYWIDHLDEILMNNPSKYERRVGQIETRVTQHHFVKTHQKIHQALQDLDGIRDDQFEAVWSKSKLILPSDEERTYARELMGGLSPKSESAKNKESSELMDEFLPKSAKPKTSLQETLELMYAAKNMSDVEAVWRSRWLALPQYSSLDYNNTLISLSLDKIIREIKQDVYFQTRSEQNYALDFILKYKYHGEIQDRSQQYKKCIRVLYFGDEIDAIVMIKNMAKAAPGVPFYLMTDRFCSIMGRLYHLVSTVDEHTAGLETIKFKCIPQSEDYNMYIQSLLDKGEDDFVYVIKTLCTSAKMFKNLKKSKVSIPNCKQK